MLLVTLFQSVIHCPSGLIERQNGLADGPCMAIENEDEMEKYDNFDDDDLDEDDEDLDDDFEDDDDDFDDDDDDFDDDDDDFDDDDDDDDDQDDFEDDV